MPIGGHQADRSQCIEATHSAAHVAVFDCAPLRIREYRPAERAALPSRGCQQAVNTGCTGRVAPSVSTRFFLCRSKAADTQGLTAPDNPVAPAADTRRRIPHRVRARPFRYRGPGTGRARRHSWPTRPVLALCARPARGAIIPARPASAHPGTGSLTCRGLHSPQPVITSTIIFSTLIILAPVPLALCGVRCASATASADSYQRVVRDLCARLRRGIRRSGIGDVNSGLRHDDRPPNKVPPEMRVVHPWMR